MNTKQVAFEILELDKFMQFLGQSKNFNLVMTILNGFNFLGCALNRCIQFKGAPWRVIRKLRSENHFEESVFRFFFFFFLPYI